MTNPSEAESRFCPPISRTLEAGEIVEVTETQAASVIANEPMFFVGYDEPDWPYYHAPRRHLEAETTSTRRDP